MLDYVSEVKSGKRLRDSDDTQEGSWGDVHVAYFVAAFSLELSFLTVLGNYVIVKLWRNDWLECLGLGYEGSHYFRWYLEIVGHCRSSQFLMDLGNVPG